MAAHPNGKRPQQPIGSELVRHIHAPHRPPLTPFDAPADAPPNVAADTAWRLLYQELFDFAPDPYVLTDSVGVIRAANHAAVELLGARKDFILDKPLSMFVAHSDWANYYNWLLRLRSGIVDAQDRPLHVRSAHGAVRAMLIYVAPFADGNSSVHMLRWRLRPMSEGEEAERALRHERYFIDSVLEAAQTLVVLLDYQGNVQRVGAAVCALLRTTDKSLHGRHWRSLFPQRLVVPLEVPGGAERTIAWGIRSQALEPTSPAALLMVGHDITELEQAQRHTLQAERLAAIGHVTAALAHEARNMLQRIQGGLDRLSWRLEQQPEALEILRRVQAAQRDMTLLFDDVRSYAAPLRLEPALANLADIWRQAWQHVLAAAPDRHAELIEEVAAVNPRCLVDSFRIEQLFRNILENAVAAAKDPVRVTVTCRMAQLDQRPALQIAFRDNGPGLPAEQRAQIFEPFYTTKPRGTGLGMAIAKRIVEAHGGTIAVGTEPGGAEIVVTLPRSPSR